MSSTETGVIFGSILWEGAGMAEACVILSDIHIDIMDYIKPAYCNEAQVSTCKLRPSPNDLIPFSSSSEACGLNLNGRIE